MIHNVQCLVGALPLGTSIVIAMKAWRQGDLFSWHPVMMSTGFLLLPTLSLLTVQGRHQVRGTSRRWMVYAHVVLQLLCVAAALVGFAAIYANKNRHGKDHFTTWHSWAGLVALTMFAMNASGGLLSSLVIRKSWVWRDPLHRLSGTLAVLSGAVAAALGVSSGWGQSVLGAQNAETLSWIILGSFAAERVLGAIGAPSSGGAGIKAAKKLD